MKKKIEQYKREEISPCAWHWVAANSKLMHQDQFQEWYGISFYDYTKANGNECMAAWRFWISDRNEVVRKEKARLKALKARGCNCDEHTAIKDKEVVWRCRMHGNLWNGVKNKKS